MGIGRDSILILFAGIIVVFVFFMLSDEPLILGAIAISGIAWAWHDIKKKSVIGYEE